MEALSKPILRVSKIKKTGAATLKSVEGHLSRKSITPNADPARTRLNETLVGDPSRPLEDLVLSALNKCNIDPSKLRKDATIANDIIMSISPAWFRPDDPDASGTWDENRLQAFKAEAVAFLRKGFGPRLVRVDLHLDEATPHIHAIVVPILPNSDKSQFRLSGKDMFNPQRLTSMQEGWERAMSRHGVGPRLRGSKTSHVKLRDYYSAVEADQTMQHVKKLTVSTPPERGYLETKDQHATTVKEWKKAEEKRIRDELRPYAVQAAKGRLFEAEKLTAQAARSDASASRHALVKMAEDYGNLDGELQLAKEEINALRNVPIRDVAQRLEYDGAINPKENAIDLVKRVGGLNFQGSIAWLHANFGHRTTAAALSQYIENKPANAPVTKAERKKQSLVSNQLKALDAEGYRITVFKDARGWNFGTSDKSLNKDILSAEDVIKSVPKLQELNHSGANIYVTPVDSLNHHILVDDLNNVTVTQLKNEGYKPAVLLETSPNNFQAVLRVPRAISGEIPREVTDDAANMFFKDLNRARGDTKIVGLVHPLRLAGFTNRKAKYEDSKGQFPFVKLIEAVNVTCHKSVRMIKSYAESKIPLFKDKGFNPKPR